VVTHDSRGAVLPIGHYVGTSYRIGEPLTPRQVCRGGTVHDLTDDEFAVWVGAHGGVEAIRDGVAWQRPAVEEHAQAAGLSNAPALVDQLLGTGLLVEVAPGSDEATSFAESHRLVPVMLGLGNSADQPDMFGIGFFHQPVLQVSHAIYDLWQWSAMDDTLWATCQNAADVARRAGATDPDYVDPGRLLTGFLGSIHALLLANAAYLDVGLRLSWPKAALADQSSGTPES
jgi:hypothetical protein